jgi:putative lipoprotein
MSSEVVRGWRRSLVAVALAATASSCAHMGEESFATPPAPSLSDATWHIYDITGGTVAAGAKTELRIDPDGKVSGSTGCNRFTGNATVVGSSLAFSPLATTRMACEPGLMAQESGILTAFQSVKSFAFVEGGKLNLLDAGGQPLLRLVRAKP